MTKWLGFGLLLAALAVNVRASDLRLSKTARPDIATQVNRPLQPGDSIIFTIEVANVGSTSASGVVVTDPIPAGMTMGELFLLSNAWTCSAPGAGEVGTVTCSLSSLGAGENRTVAFTAVLSPTYPTPSTVVNTATATSTTLDPNLGNNTATASLDVQGVPIPSLSPGALVALAGLLVIAAVVALRA